MSAPPHTGNPDRRPLPDGWITRYDDNYRAWYYVDTRAQPPRSSWDHPLPHGLPPPTSPPGSYVPPSNPPNRGYASSGGAPPYNQQQGQPYSGQPVNQAPSYPGFQGNPQEPRAYPQQAFQTQPSYGGPPAGSYGNQGWQGAQGWQQSQQGYPAQPPSQAVQQPARSGRSNNISTGLLAGGAGLLGGVLLTEGFEHHERREEEERQEAFDQGYVDGEINDDYGGGGGGVW
ncbi:hypothetical protein DFH94DRAFT_689628 [Russula ochroleuca]|uniref:WW domain-containing protein n=1 Tax=Russula ochroleuca TaxID=152965 RepID=A0A9P5N3I1_9AGAM|nr:hypothetical protein DFH94DRAFT_689628 [Russula ochroleuca]